MRRLYLCLLLLTAACSSPGIDFLGAPVSHQQVAGWRIDVYSRAGKAQAIRLSFEFGATAAKMQKLGSEAIRRATGCGVVASSVRADSSVMTATLKC